MIMERAGELELLSVARSHFQDARNSEDDNEKVGWESGGKKFLIFSKMSHFYPLRAAADLVQLTWKSLERGECKWKERKEGGKESSRISERAEKLRTCEFAKRKKGGEGDNLGGSLSEHSPVLQV